MDFKLRAPQNDQICSCMKNTSTPLFIYAIHFCAYFLLFGIGLSAQNLDTLLLKKGTLKPRAQAEVKATKEDSIKVPATTDLSKFEDLLKKAENSQDVVNLLRQAVELCTVSKLEGCDGQLKLAFGREIKRLLELNNQDKLKDAKTFYQWALASTEGAVGKSDPLLAACLKDYAQVLHSLGSESESIAAEDKAKLILTK